MNKDQIDCFRESEKGWQAILAILQSFMELERRGLG